MMMAQSFPAHQGMPQHPGLPPSHGITPAQHPTAAHPAAGVMAQVHPGVSAPAGPQVSQGGPAMGGMPPGSGTTGPGGPVPNIHALSHLGPAQAHMFQQQQFAQNFSGNPQLMQQHQHQLLRQRMMFQQAQPQHGPIPVSVPNGTQGLSAAQIAAMQANPAMRPVNLQMHLQQQIPPGQVQNIHQQQQLIALQQAQQAQHAHQAQQAQQVSNAGHPGQRTPQQRPNPQPQSIHDAQSVTPQPQQGQQQHQGSSTPQSNPSQHQGGVPLPQPTPNPQSQHIPHSQPGQQQPQHPTPQQGHHQLPMATREAQLKAQQHQHPAPVMMPQRMIMRGTTILILNSLADHLSSFESRGEAYDLLYWQSFVDKFYAPGGVLRQGVCNPQARSSKQFEISTPALARYYLTQFTSGIRQIQMVIEGPREREIANAGHIVESPRTSFIYWFTNDSQLFTTGTLRAHFDMNNKIEMLDIDVMNHTEYIPRSQLQAFELSEQKQSPKVTKNAGKRQKQPQQPSFSLPESVVTPNGVPTAVMSFLEVAETISQMQALFQFSQQNPQMSPPEALRSLVNTFHSQNPNFGYISGPMNPAMQQNQNLRMQNPNMNGPTQFASPAMAHLGLPGAQGSPHLAGSAHPSPAQAHLAGPSGMIPQGQIQPNIGQAASAGASPSVANKRRRASTVKVETEEGGGVPDINGAGPPGPTKVKASPRVGGKRQKGAA